MAYADILYSVDDHICRITLNKPEKLNALSWSTWAELEDAFTKADSDDDVRCIVLRGEGRAFSSGSDLTNRSTPDEWHPRPISGRKEKYTTRFRGTEFIYNCTKPTIAAVQGISSGAGFSLALACDIRLCREDARFSAIFTKRGIVADTGSTWYLPRLVGPERALEIFYTGRWVHAEEAVRIGLALESVAAEKYDARVNELAHQVAHGPSLAMEMDKRLVREAFTRDLTSQIELEQFLQQAVTSGSEDQKEGRMSFIEKREPNFQGR